MSEIIGTLFKYLVSLIGIGAVVAVLYQVFGANKTDTAIRDIALLQNNITSLYASQPSFATLTNTVAINSGLAPTDMISGTALTNPFGGTVTLAGTATNYTVTSTLIPAAACTKLATAFASATSIGVGATGVTAVALPPDVGTVSGQCVATNTIVFTFGH